MLNLADYHIHTKRCGHAIGEMEEYVKNAIRKGLREIGFSDHLPLVTGRNPGLTMGEEELTDYVEDVGRLQKQYPEISIKLGIEADFVPGYEEKTKSLLGLFDWDYVIGSVHMLDHWAFDNPHDIEAWEDRNVDEVYTQYYDHLRLSAKSGLFDIIGHSDLVKKFGHRPESDIQDEIERTARTFKEQGIAVELNTSGKFKPVEEMYPALSVLQIYQRYELPLIISSDAHEPEHVGRAFGNAIKVARQVGYKETVIFSKHKIVGRLPLPA